MRDGVIWPKQVADSEVEEVFRVNLFDLLRLVSDLNHL